MRINKNYFITSHIAYILNRYGAEDAVISPGSRNIPLISALVRNPGIRCRSVIDERANAFFGLGLAKATGKPVIITCTSGTAVAEFFPAVIEAFKTTQPLIILSADRPNYLRSSGANQTINQENIYGNYVLSFTDTEVYSVEFSLSSLEKFFSDLILEIHNPLRMHSGPVHINLQFEKPLEPDTFDYETDFEENQVKDFIDNYIAYLKAEEYDNGRSSELIETQFFFAGISYKNSDKEKELIKSLLSKEIAVSADIGSPARTIAHNHIAEFTEIILDHYPDLANEVSSVCQLNSAPVNIKTLALVEESDTLQLINDKGQNLSPLKIPHSIFDFNNNFVFRLSESRGLAGVITEADKVVRETLSDFLNNPVNSSELTFYQKLISGISQGESLFTGNSLTVRDINKFISFRGKDIRVYLNRGVSGIDGLIATSAGIAEAEKKPVILILGDLSFYYDLNSLYLLKERNIPLKIVIVNNRGGEIFEYLPVRNVDDIFGEYVRTKPDFNFRAMTEAFGIPHFAFDSDSDHELNSALVHDQSGPAVFELNIQREKSAAVRKNLRALLGEKLAPLRHKL